VSNSLKSTSGATPARLFRNTTVIECTDAPTLAELLAGPVGRYVVRQLSDTAIVADHAHVDDILKALRKAGYTPSVTAEERR
jgi:hypothetical protein